MINQETIFKLVTESVYKGYSILIDGINDGWLVKSGEQGSQQAKK